jgi:hypothetical protein
MPNWCSNSITISGSTETIKTLWDDAQTNWKNEDYGLLDAMVPMPRALKGTTSPAPDDGSQPYVDGHTNWYDWCVANWGTKWDVSDEGLEYVDNEDGTSSIVGYMDTAWAPPIEAYNKFLDLMDGVSIEATYHEPGMDFLGEYIDGDDNFYDGLVELIEGGAMQDDEVLARLVEDYAIEEDMAMWAEENAEENAETVQ